jgi:hypothetical protein
MVKYLSLSARYGFTGHVVEAFLQVRVVELGEAR